MPERMSMLKCLTLFRHSHMNQVWSEEEKEDINREIVKTKASRLLERYSSSTFLPSLVPHSIQHRYSLDFPHSPKRKTPPHLRPLTKSLALRFECPSSLLQNHTVQCSRFSSSTSPHS